MYFVLIKYSDCREDSYSVQAGPFNEQWQATDAAETLAKKAKNDFYVVEAKELVKQVVETVVRTIDID